MRGSTLLMLLLSLPLLLLLRPLQILLPQLRRLRRVLQRRPGVGRRHRARRGGVQLKELGAARATVLVLEHARVLPRLPNLDLLLYFRP